MKKFVTLALLSLLATCIFSQNVSLDEILNSVKETHPAYEVEAITPEILQAEKESFYGKDEWLVSGKGYYNHSEYDMLNPAFNSSDTFYAEGEVSKTLWSTGGNLKASVNTQFTDFNHLANPNSFFGNGISVSYYHPLLKNEGGFLNKFQYNLKDFEINLSTLQSDFKLESIMKQAASLYLEWISLLEQERILKRRLAISKEEVEHTKAFFEENLIEKVDLMRAEETVGNIRISLLDLQNNIKNTVSFLSGICGISDLNLKSPEFEIYEFPEFPNLKTESEFLKQNNKLLQIIEIKKQELGFIQRGYEEDLKPDLQVFAELGVSSKEEYYPRSFLLDNPTTTIGATISIPLGNSRPNNQISAAKFKVKKLEKEETEIIQDYETQINSLIEQLKVMPSVFDLNSEILETSRKRTIEEKKLYDKGLGDISSLLQSRDYEVQIELANLLHSMKIHTLLMEIDFLQGRLLKGETWEK